jgi:hypothetical protein
MSHQVVDGKNDGNVPLLGVIPQLGTKPGGCGRSRAGSGAVVPRAAMPRKNSSTQRCQPCSKACLLGMYTYMYTYVFIYLYLIIYLFIYLLIYLLIYLFKFVYLFL